MFVGGLLAAAQDYSERSVKVLHKYQSLVLSYSYFTLLLSSPLSSLISDSSLGHHLFVDDTQLFISFRAPEFSAIILHLQNTIDLVSMDVRKFSLTEFLLIGLPVQLSQIADSSLLMSLLLRLNLLAILALFLILLSRCLIISPHFLNLAFNLFAIFEV